MRRPGPEEPNVEARQPALGSSDDVLQRIAHVLGESGLYRLVPRFRRRSGYCEDDGTPTRTALYVDVETTGVDVTHDGAAPAAGWCPTG